MTTNGFGGECLAGVRVLNVTRSGVGLSCAETLAWLGGDQAGNPRSANIIG